MKISSPSPPSYFFSLSPSPSPTYLSTGLHIALIWNKVIEGIIYKPIRSRRENVWLEESGFLKCLLGGVKRRGKRGGKKVSKFILMTWFPIIEILVFLLSLFRF